VRQEGAYEKVVLGHLPDSLCRVDKWIVMVGESKKAKKKTI
jgi:hypothetical protein